MNWLVTLIVALLRVFLPAIAANAKDTAEDGKRDSTLRKRLRDRVRQGWGRVCLWPAIPIIVCLLSGCATRTVYVPDGEPVRLRETVKAAKVWVLDKEGQPVAGRMDLPEGWFVLPDPGDKE